MKIIKKHMEASGVAIICLVCFDGLATAIVLLSIVKVLHMVAR